MLCEGNHLTNYKDYTYYKDLQVFFPHYGEKWEHSNHNHELNLQAYKLDQYNQKDPVLQSQELKVNNQLQAKIIRKHK